MESGVESKQVLCDCVVCIVLCTKVKACQNYNTHHSSCGPRLGDFVSQNRVQSFKYGECVAGITKSVVKTRKTSESLLGTIYRAGFKLGGHMFEKGIFSVLYKHKSPRIFIGFSKVLKYVNF